MARLTVVLLIALAAFVCADIFVDDFESVTRSFDLSSPNDSQDRTISVAVGQEILGQEREVYMDGNNDQECTVDDSFPQSAVTRGFFNVAQGVVCSARFELRLDGSQGAADNSATQDFDLGINLNTLGTGMLINVGSDLPYSFSIEVASSSGAVSTASASVNGNTINAKQEYAFDWADFSGSADFNNIGAISIVFPPFVERDAEVEGWIIVQPNGDISGTVFEDCDCNLVRDSDEALVSNAVVTLTGTTSSSQNTDTNGRYFFGGLPSGPYTVSLSGFNLCPGSSSSRSVTVAGNSQVVDFSVAVSASSISCPADFQTTCGQTATSVTGNAQVIAECGGAPGAISFSDDITSVACTAPGEQVQTIRRTFTASGAGSCTQTITVFDDETLPSLSVPADFNTNDGDVCASDAPTSITGQASGSGPCTPVTVTFSDSASASCGNDCNLATTIARRWTARDECGNQVSDTQLIVCNDGVDCPPCPSCQTIVSNVPSIPSIPSIPSVPVTNPPTRNCRFICDDDDSSASVKVASVFAAVIAVLVVVL